MRFWIVVGIVVMQVPSSLAFLVIGNYSAAALGVLAFTAGCIFGYAASLHLEQEPPAAPRVESQQMTTRRDLVVYEITGREVL